MFVYSPGIVLNWGGLEYSPFATYGNFISLAGNVTCLYNRTSPFLIFVLLSEYRYNGNGSHIE